MLETALNIAMSPSAAAITPAVLATAAGCWLATVWGDALSAQRCRRCGRC